MQRGGYDIGQGPCTACIMGKEGNDRNLPVTRRPCKRFGLGFFLKAGSHWESRSLLRLGVRRPLAHDDGGLVDDLRPVPI